MAVCPESALLLEGTAAEELQPLDTSNYPNPASLSTLMRGRRSVRLYRDEPVDKALIEDMLQVVRWAPSGKNVQPLRFVVTSGKQRMHELVEHTLNFFQWLLQNQVQHARTLGVEALVDAWKRGCDPILRNAPHLIVAHGPKDNPMLMGSGMIAVTQLELLATANGLGACWAGYLQIAASAHAPLRQALGLAEGEAVAAALMLGKPRFRYRAVPPRKPLEVRWQ